jgi:hypothetical protein
VRFLAGQPIEALFIEAAGPNERETKYSGDRWKMWRICKDVLDNLRASLPKNMLHCLLEVEIYCVQIIGKHTIAFHMNTCKFQHKLIWYVSTTRMLHAILFV